MTARALASATDAELLARVAQLDAAVDPVPPIDTGALALAGLAYDWRAWTIWQPWASAIVGNPVKQPEREPGGPKPLDNRPRDVSRRGWVLIHAARPDAYDRGGVDRCAPLRRWLDSKERPGQWVFSAIIGAAVITGCHQCGGSCSEWAEPGLWHVEFGRRFAFEEPVPATGALGFWRPTPDVLAAVLKQLGSAT